MFKFCGCWLPYCSSYDKYILNNDLSQSCITYKFKDINVCKNEGTQNFRAVKWQNSALLAQKSQASAMRSERLFPITVSGSTSAATDQLSHSKKARIYTMHITSFTRIVLGLSFQKQKKAFDISISSDLSYPPISQSELGKNLLRVYILYYWA